ncbi:chromobox protein homolog 7-like [Rhinichthys klamathensis goyatoka]|uniref:chromobox protein homolog 7-like n=1 Tax=Rhinichthys klamathensis goyatoka TaxID=3034132 RepID=UPI0024B51B32|nr:chromobox protein homolog 7-like [Rhinichthys klamathensis goyatoka]
MISPLTRTPVMVITGSRSVPAYALIDTGSSGNFISVQLLKRLHLPRRRSPKKLEIQTILGSDVLDIPPPPDVAEEDSIYRVRDILNSRRRGRLLEYLVDWEGYGPEERTWVAREDILDPSLLTQFHEAHPNRPAPRGRGRPRRRVIGASGAAHGGGGTVTESSVTPATPSDSNNPNPLIRSLSPEY